jgi:hypothetical protein
VAEKRIERKHFKELRSLTKRRDEVTKELQEWKEAVCDEMNCYSDQLQEFSGKVFRDDCVYGLDSAGNRVFLSGTIDRMSREKLKKALEFRNRLTEITEKMLKKLDGYCEIYKTFPDLIDISKGTITEHETATVTEAEVANDD